MSLADLQREFSRFLYTRNPSDEQFTSLLERLDASGPVLPEIGLGVYRNNLLVSVVFELRSTFSRTRDWLGKSRFDVIARAYLYDRRASGRGLGEVGEAFAHFLRVHEAQEAADLADLEWAREKAFFAEADEPLSEQQILSYLEAPPEQVRLRLRTSFTLLTPNYPVHREQCNGPEAGLRIAVWRDRGRHRADEVELELWPVLKAIAAGDNLAAIAGLPEIVAAPGRLQECLGLLIMRQWLRA
ncbi:MAG: DUF2063 domain-containing protein [bacterium]|nr:DUF2063 domain-containing protein [bacterium]